MHIQKDGLRLQKRGFLIDFKGIDKSSLLANVRCKCLSGMRRTEVNDRPNYNNIVRHEIRVGLIAWSGWWTETMASHAHHLGHLLGDQSHSLRDVCRFRSYVSGCDNFRMLFQNAGHGVGVVTVFELPIRERGVVLGWRLFCWKVINQSC